MIRIPKLPFEKVTKIWKLLQVPLAANEAKHLQSFQPSLLCFSDRPLRAFLAFVSVPALEPHVPCHMEKHLTGSVLNPWQDLGLDSVKGTS